MSGLHRLQREQRPAKLKRDHFPLFLAVGLIAIGIGASLLFAHYGWTTVEVLGP
jgi:hypothetical protein